MFVRQENSPRCERRTGDVMIKQVQKWKQMRGKCNRNPLVGGGRDNIKSYEGYEVVESHNCPCSKGTHQMVVGEYWSLRYVFISTPHGQYRSFLIKYCSPTKLMLWNRIPEGCLPAQKILMVKPKLEEIISPTCSRKMHPLLSLCKSL